MDELPSLDAPEFVVCDKHGEKVKGSLLAIYVRKHLNYLLVRNSGRNDKQIYVYSDGVYKLCAPETFKGLIKQFIADYDESLITMPVVNEAFGQLSTDLNYIRIEELDADESIINFQNGLLKVTADELTLFDHTPDMPTTIQIPCNWAEKETPTPICVKG